MCATKCLCIFIRFLVIYDNLLTYANFDYKHDCGFQIIRDKVEFLVVAVDYSIIKLHCQTES